MRHPTYALAFSSLIFCDQEEEKEIAWRAGCSGLDSREQLALTSSSPAPVFIPIPLGCRKLTADCNFDKMNFGRLQNRKQGLTEN